MVMRFARLSFGEWVVLGLIVFCLDLLVIPVVQRVDWVGHTDLEIEFVVRDAETGEPIPDATIQVHSEGGLYAERQRQDFVLETDEAGRAKRMCQRCLCSGRSGWMIDTYHVAVPEWSYRASAPGYAASESAELGVQEKVKRSRRGSRTARLTVEIRLAKRGGSAP
jgi:hypothetical protein